MPTRALTACSQSTLLDLCVSSAAQICSNQAWYRDTPSVVLDSEYTNDRTVQLWRCCPHPSWRCYLHAPLPTLPYPVSVSPFPCIFGFGTHPRDRWPDVSEAHVSTASLASGGGFPVVLSARASAVLLALAVHLIAHAGVLPANISRV